KRRSSQMTRMEITVGVLAADGLSVGERPRGANRRKFLGQVGAAATFAAGALASPSVSRAEAIGGSSNSPGALGPLADVNNRRQPSECHRTPRTLLGILAARCCVHGLSFELLSRFGSGGTRVSAYLPGSAQP